jgi:hypothetical protein
MSFLIWELTKVYELDMKRGLLEMDCNETTEFPEKYLTDK